MKKKLICIMGLTLKIVLLVGVLSANAYVKSNYAQSQKLNLSIKNATIEEIFEAIEQQSEFTFFYSNITKLDEKVDLKIKNAPIDKVLKKTFADKPLDFEIIGKQIIVKTKDKIELAINNQQEKFEVSGKVFDIKNEPLIGVNILEKGTTNGTVTDLDGNYVLNVNSPEAALIFSYVGFKSKEEAVNNRSILNITLEEDFADLDEVVVIAYGTKAKSNLTGSVSSIKNDRLQDVTTSTVSSMLAGKAAGVLVSNESGKPGSGTKIRIRGKGSLNSSVDPLWVIDGVVSGTGASLSPNEIESITILKDASATALYGSRAANGVIIATTKRGKVGENKITFTSLTGISNLYMGNFEVMNSQELYEYHDGWNAQTWYTSDLVNTDTDWFDLGTQTGISQNYNLAYTGGNEKVNSFVMADYYKESGAVKGLDYERYKVKSNIDFKINEKLTLHTKMGGSFRDNLDQQHNVYSFYTYLPWDSPYNADGTVKKVESITPDEEWIGRDKSNYLYSNQYNYFKWKAIGVDGSLEAEYKILPWLTFVSTNNIGYNYYYSTNYTDKRTGGGEADNGLLKNYNQLVTTRFTNQMLKTQNSFGNSTLSTFLGYEYSDYLFEKNEAEGKSLNPGKEVLDVTSNAKSVGGNIWDWSIQSILFNANYIFKSKYMAQFSYRLDGSSKFGENKKYGNFFTVSGGWNLHEEKFLENFSFLDVFKLRVSYGSVGNTPNSNYGHLTLYTYERMYNEIPAAWPNQLGNRNLSWEKAYETNIAVDLRFLDRVDLSVEVYNKNTADLLYFVPLPALSGFTGQWQNIGELNNKGLEIVLSPDIIRNNDIHWYADFNIGFNKNEVKSLYEGQPVTAGGNKQFKEGYDMDTYYLREWAGVNPDNGDAQWYIVNEDGTKEVTNDWNAATRQMKYKSSPDFYGGLFTGINYKGISLTANINYMFGNDIYHSARELFDSDGAYPTYNQMKFKDDWSRWTGVGDTEATHPRVNATNSNKPSTRYIEDGSFVRLKNITLSYALPGRWLNKIFVNKAAVSFRADNLWLLTNFSGMDPEVAAYGSDTGSSIEGNANAMYPLTRKFVIGVNIDF